MIRSFMQCPGCRKKGVHLRLGRHDDVFVCRYCDWYAYNDGTDTSDVKARTALLELNPTHPMRPLPEETHD